MKFSQTKAKQIVKHVIKCWSKPRARWVKRHIATDVSGVPVSPRSARAAGFCMIGILDAAAANYPNERFAIERVLNAFCIEKYGRFTASVNDYNLKSKREAISIYERVYDFL